jgi:hypothetical protein
LLIVKQKKLDDAYKAGAADRGEHRQAAGAVTKVIRSFDYELRCERAKMPRMTRPSTM